MDSNYWLQKWEKNDLGFHKSEANPVLVKHFPELSIPQNSRVFVPLCGKTLDIHWLLAKGYRVAGAELAEIAVEQLFKELDLKPTISQVEKTKFYSATDIDIFVGNILDLSGKSLGSIDAIYDRAALVALPKAIRDLYTIHLRDITNNAPQLLVTFEYNQNLMSGPPFSIAKEELDRHYGDSYNLSSVASNDVVGGLKGKCPAKENVWLLRKHQSS